MAMGRYRALPPTHIFEQKIEDLENRLTLVHQYIKNAQAEARAIREQINWMKRRIKKDGKK